METKLAFRETNCRTGRLLCAGQGPKDEDLTETLNRDMWCKGRSVLQQEELYPRPYKRVRQASNITKDMTVNVVHGAPFATRPRSTNPATRGHKQTTFSRNHRPAHSPLYPCMRLVLCNRCMQRWRLAEISSDDVAFMCKLMNDNDGHQAAIQRMESSSGVSAREDRNTSWPMAKLRVRWTFGPQCFKIRTVS